MVLRYISNDETAKHLVAQWHPTKNLDRTPENTSSGSGLPVWWKCEVGENHIWEASPAARIGQKQGCPYCAGRKLLVGFNDLQTINPKLAEEWNYSLNKLSPTEVFASSNIKVWWICPIGADHIWETTVNSRNQGNKCPYCSSRKVLPGFNDLASSEYTLVVSQWHPTRNLPLEPSLVSPSSNKKVWWKCANGHEWEATIANRTRKGSGCRQCPKTSTKNVPLKAVIDSPELMAEWHKDNSKDPSTVTVGSMYKALWKCATVPDHEWEASVANRVRGSKCPICSGKKIVTGINDLASDPRFDRIASEWHPDNPVFPHLISPGTTTKVKWICSKNHVWEAQVYSRIHLSQGCPECRGRTKQSKKRLRVSDYPALVQQWHPDNTLKPEELTFRSTKSVQWVCPKNELHVWSASPSSRSLTGADCPVCASRIIVKGVNDLASHKSFSHIAHQWHPDNTITPDTVAYSSNLSAKWQCSNNKDHLWEAPIYSRTRSNASGCPFCAAVSKSSKAEQKIAELLVALGFEVERNTRKVIDGEVDIFIPSHNFAIEYNGVYWHSEAIRPDKTYHEKKHKACLAKGITLFTVWEDDWNKRQDIVIRALAHRLGATAKMPTVLPDVPKYWFEKIGARKTTAGRISYQEAKSFLDAHHIQGGAKGKYYFGLKDHENRLRAVLVASASSGSKDVLIDRYATAGTVSGGFTKLLAYAEQTLSVSRWVTFADLQTSNGSLYASNGFIVDKVLSPDYSYFVRGERVHKFNYRLKRFRDDPDLLWEDGLSERELAKLNGIHRIWDSGKHRYVKEV